MEACLFDRFVLFGEYRIFGTIRQVEFSVCHLHLISDTWKYINNSLHLARKYARIFVRGHYLFREANSFPRAKLEENCELRGTDNVQGQISKPIFAAKLRLLCLLSIGFKLGNIRLRDAFRPIARERKYLMDYNSQYFGTLVEACLFNRFVLFGE